MSGQESPAVLLLIFNRPDHTRRCLDAIAKARPSHLFVAADGPRTGFVGEADQCRQAREVVESIDWPCEVHTLFQETNLGCERAVSLAISWFFENVQSGIILEDDCIADPTFFAFCQSMLQRYRDDERVGVVTGNNFQRGQVRGDASYYFSKYNHCWGWATWKRAWDCFDFSMSHPSLSDLEVINQFACARGEDRYWRRVFKKVQKGEINSWAYRWTYSCWANRLLTVTPQNNLVENIGFGKDATHTIENGGHLPKRQQIEFPLVHPRNVIPSVDADTYCARDYFKIRNPLAQGALEASRSLIDSVRGVRR